MATRFPPPGYDAWHVHTSESCSRKQVRYRGYGGAPGVFIDIIVQRGEYKEVPVSTNWDDIDYYCETPGSESTKEDTRIPTGLTRILVDWRPEPPPLSADAIDVWVPN